MITKSKLIDARLLHAYGRGGCAPWDSDKEVAWAVGCSVTFVGERRRLLGISLIRRGGQDGTLLAFADFIESEGLPPTVRDLKALTDTSSTSVVAYRLDALSDRGDLETRKRTATGTLPSRGYQLTNTGRDRVRSLRLENEMPATR